MTDLNPEEALQSLLPDIWRAVSRPGEMAEAAAAVAQILARVLPVGWMVMQWIEPPRTSLETLTLRPDGGRWRGETVRNACPPEALERWLAWCREGAVGLRRRAGDSAVPAFLDRVVPEALKGELLAGPLATETGLVGVALLGLRAHRHFQPAHQVLFQSLLEPLARALENDHQRRELVALRETVATERRSLLTGLGRQDQTDTLIGAGGGLRLVLEQAALVTRSDAPVLILGDTGSGKELIARTIHTHSTRAEGPFIRVNCGAIPPELIDSELFGHEKGSFTGATATRRGWFERADTGTLFLDEIGELSAAAQVRLLRILQDGLLQRVGGEQQVKVDVRMIAATHRDLVAMVQNGQFRQDLWYRIAAFPILLPPLRERRQDIPALAEHFARQAAQRLGLPVRLPTAEDIALLVSYEWPGNVRELSVVMDRAAILGGGKRLEMAKALGMVPLGAMPVPSAVAPAALPMPAAILSLDQAVKQHIEAALTAAQGRVEGPHGAAALLRINPHTLRGKMRKLKIDWAGFRRRSPVIELGHE